MYSEISFFAFDVSENQLHLMHAQLPLFELSGRWQISSSIIYITVLISQAAYIAILYDLNSSF
jgi:hypothetical protein